MDTATSPASDPSAELADTVLAPGAQMPPVPTEARLEMPTQNLRRWEKTRFARDNAPNPRGTTLARLVVFGGGAWLIAYGIGEMVGVVEAGGIVGLEWPLLILFALTYGWIALSAMSGVVGFLDGFLEQRRANRPAPRKLKTRTALVMPVYNENPARMVGALRAMAEELRDVGAADGFEIFILSDTTDGNVWIEEEIAFATLRATIGDIMPIWYRRRYKNTARKAGNVADFVTRWGGRYDHMLVLDADSVMSGDAMYTLALLMEDDAGAGIIQTLPIIANRNTLYARMQQFAGRIYGPVIARGLAVWHGRDGNYWGHNAIIRTRAFAECCGLPDLTGRKPIGGHILSHDFVEAGLIRRAGWGVYMVPWLSGSYEESPPSLLDVAARDRRWAQGNLQHLGVIAAAGLRWPTRVHFATGIMSYVASPFWLILMIVGLALSLQARFIRPEYFTRDFSLFPAWPRFDAERSFELFLFTMGVLLLPKVLGVVESIWRSDVRRRAGGAVKIVVSFLIETLLSALVAPVMMLLQTRHVAEILLGRDSGWKTQRRDDGGIAFGEVVRHHWRHVAIGAAMAVAAYVVSRPILAWMSPTLIGLVMAIHVSYLSGSATLGLTLKRLGLLLTPEETDIPTAMAKANLYTEAAARELPEIEDGLTVLVSDRRTRALHESLLLPAPLRPRGKPEIEPVMAEAKLSEAASLDEALRWLTPKERMAILSDPKLIAKLDALAHPAAV